MLLPDVDTWQLIINTVTTTVTFLLVALLQNTQKRADEAVQHKLNAVADGLADLMEALSEEHPPLRVGLAARSNRSEPGALKDQVEET